jgi:UMF1 family MFS transporter
VPEPPRTLEADETSDENPIRAAFVRVWETFHELRGYRQAFLMLVAFLLYNDGIQTIIRMAAIYGAEIGIDRNAQIEAFVLVQFVGIPFSFLFGALAGRISQDGYLHRARRLHGHQRARVLHDERLAVLRARVSRGHGAGWKPGAQRSVRADDPEAQVVECFSSSLRSRSSRHRGSGAVRRIGQPVRLQPRGRLSVIIFFVCGGFVLTRVNVAEGEARARAAAAAA